MIEYEFQSNSLSDTTSFLNDVESNFQLSEKPNMAGFIDEDGGRRLLEPTEFAIVKFATTCGISPLLKLAANYHSIRSLQGTTGFQHRTTMIDLELLQRTLVDKVRESKNVTCVADPRAKGENWVHFIPSIGQFSYEDRHLQAQIIEPLISNKTFFFQGMSMFQGERCPRYGLS